MRETLVPSEVSLQLTSFALGRNVSILKRLPGPYPMPSYICPALFLPSRPQDIKSLNPFPGLLLWLWVISGDLDEGSYRDSRRGEQS